MKIPNRILELSTDEYRLMIYGLIQWRNKLLAQGRYPDAVDELFDLDADSMIAKIRTLTKDMQNTIRVIAGEKVNGGEITSYPVVTALEKYFGVKFDEE